MNTVEARLTGVDVRSTTRVHKVSSLGRARQIAEVLSRHHLWHFVEMLALEELVPTRNRLGRRRPSALSTPTQLRSALEELGPTFIKLGQVLSTRADLLPKEYQVELSFLQDEAPPIPIDDVLETIELELGEPAGVRFANFECVPLATGSLGQAHAARLHDGTEVVVKVRRPGAVEQIDEDLKLLHRLAAIAGGRLKRDGLDLVAVVDEFDRCLRAEIDYQREGRNAERFAKNFQDAGDVHIPRVFWEHTTSRVLTMERICGDRITDSARLKADGLEPDTIARRCLQIVLKMLIEDGFFHADLHPGNLFVESGTRIGLIDFGMVGALDDQTRETMGSMLFAVAGRDCDALIESMLELGAVSSDFSRSALSRDLDELLDTYYGPELGELRLSAFLGDLFGVVRRHQLVLPSSLSMVTKTVITAEGMVRELDPGFNMVEATAPYAKRLMIRQIAPQAWAERVERSAPDILWLMSEAPRAARRLLNALERGDLGVAVRPKGIEPYVQRVERTATRLVLGMIVSALLVAAAVVISTYRPVWAEGMFDEVLTGLIGGGVIACAWLLWISRHFRAGSRGTSRP